MTQEGESIRLLDSKKRLLERVSALSKTESTWGESSASDCVDECLRCMRNALVGLDDLQILNALNDLLLSFSDVFNEQIKWMGTQKNEALLGHIFAYRLWLDRLIAQAPWCPISERQLAYLADDIFQTLGFMPCGFVLYAESIPSCAPQLWVERGVAKALQNLIDQGDEHPQQVHGLMLSGSGNSASLAWIHRMLRAQGLFVSAPLVASSSVASDVLQQWRTHRKMDQNTVGTVLLIDDLHLASRSLIWHLAELLSSSDRPDLIIWSGEQEGFSQALKGSLKAIQYTLNSWTEAEWITWQTLAGGERPFSARQSGLRLADQLRISERAWLSSGGGVLSMVQLPREDTYETIELLASVMGPLPSTRALVEAQDALDDMIEGQLSFAGFLQRGPHKTWGMIWEHTHFTQWGEALAHLTSRVAEEQDRASSNATLLMELKRLLKQLTSDQLASERWLCSVAIKRLSLLTQQHPLTLNLPSPSIEELQTGLTLLKPLLHSSVPPHPISLGVLCGLALDWGAKGPKEGRIKDTLSALQLGMSASERLGDLLRGGRISLVLGKLALYEGLGALARQALETSSQLLLTLRRPQEALQALSAWAEAEVLSGALTRACKLYERAEALMSQLSYEEALWLLRFKRGQLYRQMGEATKALALWNSLKIEEGSAYSQALQIEMILAELALNEPQVDLIEYRIKSLEDDPFKQILLMRCAGLRGDWSSLDQGLSLIIELNQKRSIGAWFTACELWCLSILEEGGQQGSLEAACRMLEEAIKGAVAIRDRLTLTSFYALLAVCYQERSMTEEARVARCFVEVWRAQITGSITGLTTLRLLENRPPISQVEDSLRIQVSQEVLALIEQWKEPISTLALGT